MIALVFLATYFTRIPTPLPGGYFNLGDAVIMLAAAFLGPIGGLAAGAIGSALADLAAAAFIYAPITFVVKGIEGLVIGLIAAKGLKITAAGKFNARLFIGVIAGAVIMAAGYFTAEAFVLNLFAEGFGLAAAATELPANILQGGLSAVLGYILVAVLLKMNIDRIIR
jgi:uncharacterized membrane protein